MSLTVAAIVNSVVPFGSRAALGFTLAAARGYGTGVGGLRRPPGPAAGMASRLR